MRKRSKNASRRQRPAHPPAGTYRIEQAAPSMAQIRARLDRRRRAIAQSSGPADMMGAACEIAFQGLGKRPVLTRREAFEARAAKRAGKATKWEAG